MAQNIGKLAGKTVFITGASRGIGKAIALKVAKDGANVVIAAKTTDPHPKLPGTIYTVAKEIEAAGGRCLPCVVDVRNDDQVKSAVETAVKHFGGIDILINNASAIGLTSTCDTDMKKYDLMHNINTRGTFITSKYCIPHLQRSQNPHILTLSPPLNMNPKWFKDNLAYTMAKYGMSMCVLGMAEEFREDGIAVNALWPKTSIATAAVGMLGGQYMMEISRTPEIMSDAAYVILCKDSRTFTGNFAIDEGVLREAGVTDFDQYAFCPGKELMIDIFMEEHQIASAEGRGSPSGSSIASSTKESSSQPPSSGGAIDKIFESLNDFITPKIVKNIQTLYHFVITGEEAGEWFIDLKTGNGGSGKGKPAQKPDVEITINSQDAVKLFKGELKAATAFMSGKLKIKGDMAKAIKLDSVLVEAGEKVMSKL